MANESWLLSTVKIDPQDEDITVVGTGSTLAGSNVVQIDILKSAFTTAEGKIRVLNALNTFRNRIIEYPFPLT